jgi:hypothetical protein
MNTKGCLDVTRLFNPKTHQGTFKEPTMDLDKHAAKDRGAQKKRSAAVCFNFVSTVFNPSTTR